jgi:hypothetical protein
MEYQATFEIDCGVSPGFGLKYPDHIKKTETLSADSSKEAYKNAMSIAKEIAGDYLSNPNTGFTTVQLLSLRSSEGCVPFNVSKSVVKRSTLENILALFSASPKK